MKAKQALEIAEGCGLETVEKAIYNIKIHAMSIFAYGEEINEYRELLQDCSSLNM